MWALPIVGYQISFLTERTTLDIVFVVVFAILFGFGTALYHIVRQHTATTCTVGGGSGILALFTLLCPVCPIFFLGWFGLSATVMAISPYFWGLRLLSVLLLLVGITLLWKKFAPKEDGQKSMSHYVFNHLTITLIIFLFLLNQSMIIGIGHAITGSTMSGGVLMTGDFAKDVVALVTPRELPFYGSELGLDMSNMNAINVSIAKLGVMAPQQGSKPIQLTDEEMERYIAIGTEPYVTCEFCCGVKTLVREDGSPTCACAHSIAMRGTAAYLIKNYPNMTNAEIAYELMRQKGLYFPIQMQQRMASALAGEKSDFLPDIKYLTMNLTDAELTDLKKQASSSGFTPETTAPGMVGGC
ncbi:MAG: hypothetical protein COX81_03765 [Candidatus Magasanikbacteria bacterium CG_4_10_14_0_2_um_filter_37_12]|nr:MAG: hypothetical protein COX81_03765 [Candidatus Magasanikbacteria bacterium CG_4_10_14_0_2_um_filter_37_12]